MANTSIDFSLRDGSFNALTMDQSTSCVLQTAPTLCQNSLTYPSAAPDRGSDNLVIYYGGQGARVVSVSHPLVALSSARTDYTSAGMPAHVYDIYGHSIQTTYDSNGLYPTQRVVTAAPSPNQTTNLNYNSLGQLILSTRVNGAQSVAEQLWLDSWGRTVGEVQNCVAAVAPPSLCNATPDPATNVMTRYAFDLNGNLIDRYDQAQVSGSWIDTHYLYDADNNQVAEIRNCVTVTNPCDGTSNFAQNVVSAYAFDAMGQRTDAYQPMPGCSPTPSNPVPCVPAPVCSAGPPPSCVQPATPCPGTTCVDQHTVYNLAGQAYLQVANYTGSGDASQANVTTQFLFDGDGRITDILAPITGQPGQTGAIDEHRVYDVLGRMVTDIRAYSIPSWMPATTQARTDYSLDAGGRVVSITGPGTGSNTQTNRIVTSTDYDDLGRPLSITIDASGLDAVSKTVYDPRGARHDWTPATQQLSAGLETTTSYDLAGQVISMVKDDGSGELHLTTSTSYDAYGRPTDVVDPRGIDTKTAYDALNRTSSVTLNCVGSGGACNGSISSDQNLTTSYVYDLAGNQTQSVNPRSIVQFTSYDALGRVSSVTQNCQAVPTPPAISCGTQSSDVNVFSQQSVDQLGNLLTTTDPLGRINTYGYDALGRKTSATQNYCPSGNSNPNCSGSTITSSQNLTTTWQLDAQGEVLTESQPRQCTSVIEDPLPL